MIKTIALAAIVTLAGCTTELPDEYKKSSVVAVCHDGTWVVRGDHDQRLRVIKMAQGYGNNGMLMSEVDKETKPQDVCR